MTTSVVIPGFNSPAPHHTTIPTTPCAIDAVTIKAIGSLSSCAISDVTEDCAVLNGNILNTLILAHDIIKKQLEINTPLVVLKQCVVGCPQSFIYLNFNHSSSPIIPISPSPISFSHEDNRPTASLGNFNLKMSNVEDKMSGGSG